VVDTLAVSVRSDLCKSYSGMKSFVKVSEVSFL